ncbi:MAG TPA: histidine--tRNA ligase [Vicinamibacterales bacterium]|nr:histidine--tRNA ligase [Vicinamibacterales bacterium]
MNTHPARGMRDFLPEDVRRRQYVIDVIAGVYQRYGFEPLETPAVENIETLMGKYGEEGDRLIFRILKRGEEGKSGEADLALRYDLTVPLARVVAQYRAQLPRFFKRYQIQPVWRADRPQKGRFREFYQCDVDCLGSTSPIVEAELCAAVSDVLDRLGFKTFDIIINHRALLTASLKQLGFVAEQHSDVITLIDKVDKIGLTGLRTELRQKGFSETQVEGVCRNFLHDDIGPSLGADWLDFYARDLDLEGHPSITNLKEIFTLIRATSAEGRVKFEPCLARGLSYYTGAIFEVKVEDLAGSLGGGGRYDNLVGMFSGREVPAAGFSLGLERILVVMTERGMFPDAARLRPADVMVTICNFNDGVDELELKAEALRLAAQLRSGGVSVEVFPDVTDLGKQIKYAGERGIPFATVIGARERDAGRVGLRDLASRQQEDLSVGELVTYLQDKKLTADSPEPGAARG